MIRQADEKDADAVLRKLTAVPATGPLCEMHWHLLMQNRHMPHRFYITDSGAVLKLSGRRAALCGVPQAPAEARELADFLAFSRVDRLTAVDWYPPAWYVLDNAAVLARAPGQRVPAIPLPPGFDAEPPVDDILAVLESTSGRMQPEGVREGFWVDFHIRRNHGVSRVYGIWEGGVLAATAGAWAINAQTAYIACVETLPGYRHRGYATALVAHLCAGLPAHTLTLMCADETTGFYGRLGFAPTGQRCFICQNPAE